MQLKREGVAIIYISHKLDEVREVQRPGYHPLRREKRYHGGNEGCHPGKAH